MKLPYFALLLFVTFFAGINAADPIDTTAELIKKGDVQQLAKMFSSTIELTIAGEENIYSRSQAEIILTGFFKNHPPKSVTVIHRVSSNPNYRFAVLLLTTANGNYRTSVSLKNINGAFILDELRIESEKTK